MSGMNMQQKWWEKLQSDYFEYQRKQEVQQQKNSSIAIQNTKRNMSAKCGRE
jgi:hypothetical protein